MYMYIYVIYVCMYMYIQNAQLDFGSKNSKFKFLHTNATLNAKHLNYC